MLSAEEGISATLPEKEPVGAIVNDFGAAITTKEDNISATERQEDPYIAKNAMAIYSWARFQEGPIKLSDVKEVYMVKCCAMYKNTILIYYNYVIIIANILRLWTLRSSSVVSTTSFV